MSVTINGIFENGQVKRLDLPPTKEKVPVTVTFPEIENQPQKNEIKFGSLAGRINVPDNFDDELDELKEYR